MDIQDLATQTAKEFQEIFFPNAFHLGKPCFVLTRNLLIQYIHSVINIHDELTEDRIKAFSQFLWDIIEAEFTPTRVRRANLRPDDHMIEETERFIRFYRIMYYHYTIKVLNRRFPPELSNIVRNFLFE
jgi:hypothetical protein